MTLELCKGVHCVDLGESFQTYISLQKLVSIQPRTSPLSQCQAYLPTVGRDVVYGIARNKMAGWLMAANPQIMTTGAGRSSAANKM